MRLADPRTGATFVVRVVGDPGAGKTSLAQALLDFPLATDEDVARLRVLDGEEDVGTAADAFVLVVRGPPTPPDVATARDIASRSPTMLIAVHACDDGDRGTAALRRWGEAIEGARAILTATPPGLPQRGTDELRAALLRVALDASDIPVARARRAKRPYATAIIAGAALAAAAEGLLPGAAAFVFATQVGAITALYYLYTGNWLARSQVLAVFPAFASEAVGSSAFLIAKSFLPPTGVADAAAAVIAASLTIAMLGGIAWLLEQGHSLQESHQIKLAFRRMRAKTRAERAAIVRDRHRWRDKEFWKEVVRRVVFS
jgi:hypothetical protein